MPRPPLSRDIPPPLELECLRVLWALGEGNAARVREALAPERPLAYTTVLTLLDRLAKRGQLARRKQGRSYLYKPLQDRETLRQTAVAELVHTYFDGDTAGLVRWLQSWGHDHGRRRPEMDRSERPLDAALL
ncbi:MAG: BlaI/MecI/CopY family transcriptional regulator [Acidobacteriota bacterium]